MKPSESRISDMYHRSPGPARGRIAVPARHHRSAENRDIASKTAASHAVAPPDSAVPLPAQEAEVPEQGERAHGDALDMLQYALQRDKSVQRSRQQPMPKQVANTHRDPVLKPVTSVGRQVAASDDKLPSAPQPTVPAHQSRDKHLAHTARKADMLQRAVHQEQAPVHKKRRQGFLRSLLANPIVSGGLIAVILGVTGYISIDTWLTNRQVESRAVAASDAAGGERPEQRQATEGRDETPIKKGALANYRTAADIPRALYVNKLKIASRLLPMGVNNDSSLQAPINIYDAGWYTGSAKPGTGGAVVIDGHASGPTRQGLFAYLNTLVAGDTVTVETGDGTKYDYKVVAKEEVDYTKVDMKKLMLPHGSAVRGVNLITCSGKWVDAKQTYDHRTIVYTELIK